MKFATRNGYNFGFIIIFPGLALFFINMSYESIMYKNYDSGKDWESVAHAPSISKNFFFIFNLIMIFLAYFIDFLSVCFILAFIKANSMFLKALYLHIKNKLPVEIHL